MGEGERDRLRGREPFAMKASYISFIWISLMHTRNMNYKTNSCMLYINKKIKADTLEEEIIKMLQHLPFPVLLFSFVLIIFSKMYNSKLGILH